MYLSNPNPIKWIGLKIKKCEFEENPFEGIKSNTNLNNY